MRAVFSALMFSTLLYASNSHAEDQAAAPVAVAPGTVIPLPPSQEPPPRPGSVAGALALKQSLARDPQDPRNYAPVPVKKPVVRPQTLEENELTVAIQKRNAAAAEAFKNGTKLDPHYDESVASATKAAQESRAAVNAVKASAAASPIATKPAPATETGRVPPADTPPLPASAELKPVRPDDKNSPVSAELSDGTRAVFGNDGSVNIVAPNGVYHVPPDGVYTLKDGTSFALEGGMRVDK